MERKIKYNIGSNELYAERKEFNNQIIPIERT